MRFAFPEILGPAFFPARGSARILQKGCHSNHTPAKRVRFGKEDQESGWMTSFFIVRTTRIMKLSSKSRHIKQPRFLEAQLCPILNWTLMSSRCGRALVVEVVD